MPLKILFIADHLVCGGADKVTLELADYLGQQGHSISIAVLNGNKNFLSIPASIHYIDLQFCESFALGKLWKDKTLSHDEQQVLHKLLDEQKFDAVILGYNNGHWLKPYINGNVWHWVHADLIAKRPANHFLKALTESIRIIRHQRKFRRLLDHSKIITVSPHLTEKYKPLLPNAILYTVNNGINQEKLLNSIDEAPHSKQWDVVFVGRLDRNKQVDHALRAFSESGLTGRMLIVGDGAERQCLEAYSAELNISDRVDFIGQVNNPATYILQSKCLILSSFSEGAPICIAEALSLGTPVVAYACSGGIKEQLSAEHLQQGLVKPQDVAALAQRIYEVVNAPYIISHADKEKVSIQTMASNFLNLINER